jgi:hypothetical protein
MIIDLPRRYIYVQAPQTGSTLIGKLLINKYGATTIGSKHSFLWELPWDLQEKLDDFFVFTAVRDPFEQKVSAYAKGVGPLAGETFEHFIQRTHPGAFLDWRVIEHERCDKVLRLGSLEDDFLALSKEIGISHQGPLEQRNVTSNRHEEKLSARRLAYVFGPHRTYLNTHFDTKFAVNWSILSPLQLVVTNCDYRIRVSLLRWLTRHNHPPGSRTSIGIDRCIRAALYPIHRFNTRNF